jgi:hypothetical protein
VDGPRWELRDRQGIALVYPNDSKAATDSAWTPVVRRIVLVYEATDAGTCGA